MTTAGPNYPSTASGWTNSGNVGASDGVYAETNVGGSSNSAVLTATNLGFSIPAGSTIDGVYVEVRRQGASLAHSDQSVRLVIGGSASGSNYSKAGTWSTSDTTQTYGGASDKWGLTPSASDINASNFGLAFQCKNALAGSRTAYVDFIRISVYYTAPTVYDLVGTAVVVHGATGADVLVSQATGTTVVVHGATGADVLVSQATGSAVVVHGATGADTLVTANVGTAVVVHFALDATAVVILAPPAGRLGVVVFQDRYGVARAQERYSDATQQDRYGVAR